ncbi:restriction endonuclease subunit S [Staphylococcus aureus]|uniref:restriction endonuclease subunit S n=1 Tax=Staphylococcus aureus TaxID=1280 RepID=UPI000D572A4C|nr:restriction endonuclease subunit S [Staphylococcus aureus]NGQ42704.1 restriction endonuclease subunit S [Staphylococcus aureus]NUX74914.1 restriction endonuclease subunit S [Staphylococcus aureus]PVV93651.1 restriction endonuclease subunit S [Staphylococcus aureus]
MSNTQKKNVPELRFPGFEGEWEEKKLGNLTTKIGSGKTPKGGSENYTNKGIPFLRSQNIRNGKLNLNDLVYISKDIDDEMKNSRTYYGDVLLNITGASIGRTAINSIVETHANLNQHVCIIRLKKEYYYNFFGQYLLSRKGKRKIFLAQSGGSREGLNFKEIANLKIFTPTIFEEQQKIGQFFSKLDQQIELEEQKLELLQQQKKCYIQKIFSQELRFKDENGEDYPDWENSKIEKYLKERNERSDKGQMLSVTINSGIIKFSELDRKDNSSKDKSNYKVVRKNDIAYNSMRMWQGASGKSNYNGIVSPAYTVLYPTQNTSSLFIGYKFKTHRMIHKFKINSQGLTSDTWNLKYKQLKNINIDIPVLEEQEKIGDFFKKMDILISKQKMKIEILEKEKQSFLQKMFL